MNDMTRFGSVGKIAIKNAIGLQHNRKEIEYEEVQMLDEAASGCFACKYRSLKQAFKASPTHPTYQAACSACAACPHKLYNTEIREKIKYINDKNKYGDKTKYSATLKSNALKLLLVLHLLHPDRYGIVMNVRIDYLASILTCDRKTILANLETLKTYNYIDYIRILRKGVVNISILGYENYFLPAAQGGRGYMTFSDTLILELIKLKDLTSLRLFLQELVEIDNYSNTERNHFSKSYNQLKDGLPDYYKPNHIRKGLLKNSSSPIFTVTLSGLDTVTFELNPAYNAKQVKEEVIRTGREHYKSYFEFLNDSFETINDGFKTPEELLPKCYYKNKPDFYAPYPISRSNLEDIGLLSWQYSEFDITDGIDYIYINYVLHNKPIETYGGLLRTVINEIIENRKTSLGALQNLITNTPISNPVAA